MKNAKLTHIDRTGNPSMVDVSSKASTRRVARARAIIDLDQQIIDTLKENDLHTNKGSVVQTAIIAGVMAAKKTSDLIPLCHPLGLEDCQLSITLQDNSLVIESMATIEGKTGVEMEALTAATIAALTIYDMCKGLSHNIVIKEIRLLEKTGGKNDFKYKPLK